MMIDFYSKMVRFGRIKLEQVPALWRAEVEAALATDAGA